MFEPPIDPAYTPLPEDRPGGFNWGNDDQVNQVDDDANVDNGNANAPPN